MSRASVTTIPWNPELVLEQIGDDRRGSRGHAIGVRLKRWNGHVRHHDGIDSGGDGSAERRQFHGIQARPVAGDLGQAEMRIGCGVAVAGEMFGRGHHSVGARSLDVGGYEIADLLRIFSEGARVDDGVRGIRVDVGIGKEIPVHADGARLLGGDAAEGLRIFCLSGGAEGHGVREHGRAMKAHGDAALKIGGERAAAVWNPAAGD